MAGEVTYTPMEEDVIAGSRDWFKRLLRQPRMKGVIYVTVLVGALLGAAFALQAGAPLAHALRPAAIGALLGLLSIATLLALRYALLPGQAARSFRQNKTIHKPYTYGWTDEALSWQSESSNGRVLWSDLHRWSEGKSAFLFAVSDRGVHFVPRRALSETEAADLRATASRYGPPRL